METHAAITWLQWATLSIALLGAALGVFNTVLAFGRERVRIKVTAYVQQGDDGIRRLRVKTVNTGRVPVTVEKVLLTGSRANKPKAWELWEHNRQKLKLPCLLQPGQSVVVVMAREAVDEPFMRQCFTVMAQTAEGRRIKGRGAGLRQLAAEMQAAAGKAAGDPAP